MRREQGEQDEEYKALETSTNEKTATRDHEDNEDGIQETRETPLVLILGENYLGLRHIYLLNSIYSIWPLLQLSVALVAAAKLEWFCLVGLSLGTNDADDPETFTKGLVLPSQLPLNRRLHLMWIWLFLYYLPASFAYQLLVLDNFPQIKPKVFAEVLLMQEEESKAILEDIYCRRRPRQLHALIGLIALAVYTLAIAVMLSRKKV
ncbi:unnamed protein product [Protopolystoma xenopodis]|uniref:Uncharacterized protein n=1 Tax=Protopolystoma xenopodis TaxID=117903 RepID=A0A3S4ZUH7_9PLAT|nr:unnamed protein product [Protopolystoma xenopodis]